MRLASAALLAVAGLSISAIGLAEGSVCGDWGSGTSDDKTFMYAATLNDSGELFGEYCYFATKKCGWYVMLHTACNSGSKYVVLANTDASAVPLTMTCGGKLNSGLFSDYIEDWKGLESSLTDSIHVGFAIPLAEDKFTVVRFSLKGRTQCQSTLESAFTSTPTSPEHRGTTDQQL